MKYLARFQMALPLSFLVILTQVTTTQALSIEGDITAIAGNLTTLNTQIAPSWVSSSSVRGTSDILWSCIVTLTACVYTAIHLNVPPAHVGKWQAILWKMKWVALVLFAPEIVLYCASEQFWQARNLVKQLNKIRKSGGCNMDHSSTNEVRPQPGAVDIEKNRGENWN